MNCYAEVVESDDENMAPKLYIKAKSLAGIAEKGNRPGLLPPKSSLYIDTSFCLNFW